jgi:hypothetical protein
MNTKRKRAFADKQYRVISHMKFLELRENGIYYDEFGPLTEIHHVWERSHCPLWYTFQPENMVAVSRELHHAIHNVAPSDMTSDIREYYDEFEIIKQQLINNEQH